MEKMASSSPALSPVLRDLLHRAKAERSLEALVSELLSDQGDEFELFLAAKRRVML